MNGWTRAGLLLSLFIALGVLFVAFGSVEDVPTDSIRDKETKRVIADPGPHVGEMVIVDGTVVATDPVVLRLAEANPRNVSVMGVERGRLSTGSQAYVVGELVATDRVRAHRIVVEEPWEVTNMYLVSVLAGLVILGRLGRHWRFDRTERAFAPRTGKPTSGDGDG